MWKSVELYMNGTQVSEAHALYPYLAYMSTLTNYVADVQKTRLLSAGWTKDTCNNFDINVSTDASENEGQLQRAKWFRESRWNKLIGKLNIDPFQQQLLLIPGVTLFLRLIPHNPEFCLIAPPATPAVGAAPAIPAPDFRLDINRAVLRIPCKEVNVNQLAAIQKMMLMKPILLPFGKRAIKHFTVGTGASSFGQDNAYIGTIPHRVTIMMVADTNFSGSYITNPFFFNHFDLSYLALNVNGEQIPRDPLQPDFTLATRDTTRAYFEVIKSMGDLAGGVAINLTPSEFAEGYTFFPLKLTPGPIKVHGLKSPSRHGSVRIELKFRNALPRNINVIVLAEFDAYLRIEGAKNVTVE